MVFKAAKVVHIPVIGCGGIACAEDALEFIMAGATGVQIGTAILTDPQLGINVLEGIESYLRQNGVQNLAELIGVAHA
jgi:dihydroorotate dehydrogenase (NAD+) catalytic subunit